MNVQGGWHFGQACAVPLQSGLEQEILEWKGKCEQGMGT